MAFTEANRVQIRRWLGFPNLYMSVDPRLEEAITALQASSDGGSRPDASAEDAIKGYLTKLQNLEARMEDLQLQMAVGKVDEVEIDAARGHIGLKMLAYQYIGHISDALSVRPLRDVLSPVAPKGR